MFPFPYPLHLGDYPCLLRHTEVVLSCVRRFRPCLLTNAEVPPARFRDPLGPWPLAAPSYIPQHKPPVANTCFPPRWTSPTAYCPPGTPNWPNLCARFPLFCPLMQKYRPRASVIPSALDLTDCPYMWPHCRQPLYAGGGQGAGAGGGQGAGGGHGAGAGGGRIDVCVYVPV